VLWSVIKGAERQVGLSGLYKTIEDVLGGKLRSMRCFWRHGVWVHLAILRCLVM
jgi:hypothetical protein